MPWLAGAGAAAGGTAAAGAAGTGATLGASMGAGLGSAGTAALSTVPSAALTGTSLGGAATGGLGIGGATSAGMGTAGGLGLGGAAATPAMSVAAAPTSLWSQLTNGAGQLGNNIVENLKQQASDRFQSATGGLTADPKGAQPKRIGTAKQKLPKLEAADTSGTPGPGPRRGVQDMGNPNERMAMILQSIFAPRGY